MIDTIKKAMLAGVGAAVLSAEKVEDALSGLVDKGKVSAAEAKDLARTVAARGKEEFEVASRDLQKAFKELVDKSGVGQKERIDALEKRLLALEVEIANLVTRLNKDHSR